MRICRWKTDEEEALSGFLLAHCHISTCAGRTCSRCTDRPSGLLRAYLPWCSPARSIPRCRNDLRTEKRCSGLPYCIETDSWIWPPLLICCYHARNHPIYTFSTILFFWRHCSGKHAYVTFHRILSFSLLLDPRFLFPIENAWHAINTIVDLYNIQSKFL